MYRNKVLFFFKNNYHNLCSIFIVSRLNAAAQFNIAYNENENISLAILSVFLTFSLNV